MRDVDMSGWNGHIGEHPIERAQEAQSRFKDPAQGMNRRDRRAVRYGYKAMAQDGWRRPHKIGARI